MKKLILFLLITISVSTYGQSLRLLHQLAQEQSTGAVFSEPTYAYSVRQFHDWSNAIVKIRRSSDDAVKYVFFDESGDISLTSKIADSNTTPSGTSLSFWLSTDDAYVEEWFCQKSDDTIDTGQIALQTTTSRQPKIATAGVLETKNGNTTITFDGGTDYLSTTDEFSELGSTLTSTIFTVAHVENAGDYGIVLCTSESSTTRYVQRISRGSGKIIGIVNADANKTIYLLSQENSADQRIQTTYKNSTTLTGYLNGVEQDTETWSGTHTNDIFRIGAQQNGNLKLEGSVQEILIYDSDKISEISTINSNIDTYYSIP